jgi:CHAT domain-containing protein/tetratricopeptide (TPR) repeat protein
MRGARVGVVVALAYAAPLSAVSSMDECAPSAGEAWTQQRLMCLYTAGMRDDRLPEARARLQRLGAGQADQPWPTLVLALTVFQADEGRALALYEIAAGGFARVRDAEGEVLARHNLRNILQRRGDFAAADRQVEQALEAAEASGQPLPLARAAVLEASHELRAGGDVGQAYRTLQRAQQFAFPDGPVGLRRAILLNLANASLYLGRLDDAIEALERHRALRQEDGSTVDAATVAFNLLNARLTQSEQHPRAAARERLTAQALEVLDEVQRLRRPALVASTHRVLADLLRTSDPGAAVGHLDRCLELERTLDYPQLRAGCLWTRSLIDARRDPVRADRASRDAIDALADNPDGPRLVYAWQARLRLVWQTMPEDEAMPASLQALDAIEGLRARQQDEDSRAALFSTWTRDYYWLAGRLLDAKTPRLAEAFEVGERLRARELLERVTRSAPPPPFASLEAVRQALDETEAVLWYSVAPWEDVYGDFGGGAWLVVVTRSAVRLHRMAASTDLDTRVAALVGLLRDRGTPVERWEPATEGLGGLLLGPAVSELPSRIQRLVIVSDGELHRLPFEALRPDRGQPRLGERFAITVVPSATLWLRLRRGSAAPASDTALVFADPELARGPAGEVPLAALPWARREARAIARTLRLDPGQVREGGAASEDFLKQAPLGRFAVLHLAAHARADEAFPDRSAVFLAPGSAAEDGWLQPREIAALDFGGRLVVLSACESASGFLLSGEGPLSLARAFFAGGAGGVVATRWPLRDDDAAFVMGRFYRALATGVGAAVALRRARQEAIDVHLPAAVWAGLVLVGDGLRPPFRQAVPQSPFSGPAAIILSAIALLGLAAVVHRLTASLQPRRGGRR